MRKAIAQTIIDLSSGGGAPSITVSRPRGDPGLFGPDSVAWRVNADFTSMLCGGVGALLLQALHPLALAGVWDHSNFREDILGRLRRTAHFVAGTTYAPTADAHKLIEHVRWIHARVSGEAPDGRVYHAEDPALLRWVHVTEVYSFLQSYLAYVNPRLSKDEQDQYFAETARVAEFLGANEVPVSLDEALAYMERMQPELDCSDRSREVLRILLDAPAPRPWLRPAVGLFIRAGMDLLPDWAKRQYGMGRGHRLTGPARSLLIHSIARPLRWSVRRGIADVARERMR